MKRFFLIILMILLLAATLHGCAQKEVTDGTYTVEVTLSGGSGRASVESPCRVVIAGGKPTATIVWGSSFYEYMMIGDIRYDPVQEEVNSTFEIPVVFDEDMAVSASTIAMSQPHLVDYVLRFDSKTLKGE